MNESASQPFKLHLPGLLKVLAEHLYSNKQVAVRELIQNAHDGCRRRQSEASEANYSPQIRLEIDAPRRILRVIDNGFGLTRSEIEDYLATIGRSYTRELRQNLSALSPDEAAQLIGQFGFGFLSAFLLADDVRVVTRSFCGDEAFEWTSDGGENYQIRDAERDQAGTTVELRVKSAASFVLREGQLLEIVRQYADFLPLPIYVGNDPQPANLQTPPWEAADVESATQNYIERTFGAAPLAVIPLHDHTVSLGHDTLTLPLSGFLLVPAGSVVSVREYGDVLVFIRRMFICREDKALLPPWARFVRGVIDCPHLQPTASREDLHQDDNFEATRAALEIQLAEGLQNIARHDPEAWEKIVRGHTDLITGWAARDDAFFDAVCDIVTFRTSRGPLTLPQYLEESGGDVFFTTRELGSLQERLLAEAHGVPVIDASWFGVQPFLAKYAYRTRDCELVRLDGQSQELLRPVEDPLWSETIEFFARRGVTARVCAFAPAEVPALMFYPEDAEFAIEGRAALDEGEIADPLAALLGDYLQNHASDAEKVAGTLVLNASNDLARALAGENESASRDAAFDLIWQMARLFSGRTLNARDAARAFAGVTGAVELMRSRH
ncbi:MAG: ATP-binding protein [Armatimonadetes bacterium]|nr:ATP-binding protein [Armatimonadota bacterium]